MAAACSVTEAMPCSDSGRGVATVPGPSVTPDVQRKCRQNRRYCTCTVQEHEMYMYIYLVHLGRHGLPSQSLALVLGACEQNAVTRHIDTCTSSCTIVCVPHLV